MDTQLVQMKVHILIISVFVCALFTSVACAFHPGQEDQVFRVMNLTNGSYVQYDSFMNIDTEDRAFIPLTVYGFEMPVDLKDARVSITGENVDYMKFTVEQGPFTLSKTGQNITFNRKLPQGAYDILLLVQPSDSRYNTIVNASISGYKYGQNQFTFTIPPINNLNVGEMTNIVQVDGAQVYKEVMQFGYSKTYFHTMYPTFNWTRLIDGTAMWPEPWWDVIPGSGRSVFDPTPTPTPTTTPRVIPTPTATPTPCTSCPTPTPTKCQKFGYGCIPTSVW